MVLNEQQVYRYYWLRQKFFGRDQRTYNWGITARALGREADEMREWRKANGYRDVGDLKEYRRQRRLALTLSRRRVA